MGVRQNDHPVYLLSACSKWRLASQVSRRVSTPNRRCYLCQCTVTSLQVTSRPECERVRSFLRGSAGTMGHSTEHSIRYERTRPRHRKMTKRREYRWTRQLHYWDNGWSRKPPPPVGGASWRDPLPPVPHAVCSTLASARACE